MRKSVIALRVVWAVLILVFLSLVLTNVISGWGTFLFSVAVLAALFAEMWLQRRTKAGSRR